jgi:hypothetical protein
MPNKKIAAQERFTARINKISKNAGKNDCWLWSNGNTYGLFRSDDGMVGAHRYSWEHFNGPIPDGMVVLHLCQSGGNCVRPSHLAISTHASNQQHKVLQGRSSKYADRKSMV